MGGSAAWLIRGWCFLSVCSLFKAWQWRGECHMPPLSPWPRHAPSTFPPEVEVSPRGWCRLYLWCNLCSTRRLWISGSDRQLTARMILLSCIKLANLTQGPTLNPLRPAHSSRLLCKLPRKTHLHLGAFFLCCVWLNQCNFCFHWFLPRSVPRGVFASKLPALASSV